MNKHVTFNPRRIAASGFTLVEMLAVIVLIGIVAGIVVTAVGKRMNSGKYKAGAAQVQSLSMKIQTFMLDNGHPPEQLKFLTTEPADAMMWNGPYASDSDLKDPFGHKFGYKVPGDHGLAFDLVFYGRDGKPGGEKLNQDVGNWE